MCTNAFKLGTDVMHRNIILSFPIFSYLIKNREMRFRTICETSISKMKLNQNRIIQLRLLREKFGIGLSSKSNDKANKKCRSYSIY